MLVNKSHLKFFLKAEVLLNHRFSGFGGFCWTAVDGASPLVGSWCPSSLCHFSLLYQPRSLSSCRRAPGLFRESVWAWRAKSVLVWFQMQVSCLFLYPAPANTRQHKNTEEIVGLVLERYKKLLMMSLSSHSITFWC